MVKYVQYISCCTYSGGHYIVIVKREKWAVEDARVCRTTLNALIDEKARHFDLATINNDDWPRP